MTTIEYGVQNATFIMKLFSLISKLIGVYSFAILIRILISWFPQRTMYNQYGQPVQEERPLYDFLRKITDPFLNLFRSRKLTLGSLDFSTLIALMALSIAKSLADVVATFGTITIGMILAVIVQGLWGYVINYFLILMIIMLGIRWFIGRKPGSRGYAYASMLDRILAAPVNFVFRVFYGKGQVSQQKLVATAFWFYLVLYFVIRYLFNLLIPLLYSI